MSSLLVSAAVGLDDGVRSFLEPHLRQAASEALGAPELAEQLVMAEEELGAALPGRTLALTVVAPRAPAETLLEVSDLGDGFLWHPPGQAAVAGVGACHRLQLDGATRFADLRHRADAIFAGLSSVESPELVATGNSPLASTVGEGGAREAGRAEHLDPASGLLPAPRLYGGLAFDVGAARQEPWAEFGDGCFLLPRYLYRNDGELATLTLAVRVRELRSATAVESTIGEASELLEALEGARSGQRRPAGSVAMARPVDSHVADGQTPRIATPKIATPQIAPQTAAAVEPRPADAEEWIQRVEGIRQAIGRGEVEKIVAARRSVVELGSAAGETPAATEVLGWLERDHAGSTRFAFVRDSGVFLGVTPEKLIAKQGSRIVTEALAGSIASGGEHAAELLDSGKDRLEQQLVVDAIVRRLEPLCEHLEVGARPTVRELRDVLHLHTSIVGILAEPRHILQLVEMLHPTPAVGGVPTARALEWIRGRETHERGWYAAPIGWFDAEGDGELAVALRSCVLSGDRAYLYAGAGIVADSDPEQELRETELKKQALSSLLQSSPQSSSLQSSSPQSPSPQSSSLLPSNLHPSNHGRGRE